MRFTVVALCLASAILGAMAQVEQIAGQECAEATQFCFQTSAVFRPTVAVGGEGSFACLDRAPNPGWFWMEVSRVDGSGFIEWEMSMTADTGDAADVDFAVFGPFSSYNDAMSNCDNLHGSNGKNFLAQNGNTCDMMCDACSYHPQSVEHAKIVNSNAGQVYLLLVTNFADVPATITMTQTTNAEVDCGCDNNLLCLDLEDRNNCPNDCDNRDRLNDGGYCGDNRCRGDESYENCPRDCDAVSHYWGVTLVTTETSSNAFEMNIHGTDGSSSGWIQVTSGLYDTHHFQFLWNTAAGFQVSWFEVRLTNTFGSDGWSASSILFHSNLHGWAWRWQSVSFFAGETKSWYVSTPSSYTITVNCETHTTHSSSSHSGLSLFMDVWGTSGDTTGYALIYPEGTPVAGAAGGAQIIFDWFIGDFVSYMWYISGTNDGWLWNWCEFNFGFWSFREWNSGMLWIGRHDIDGIVYGSYSREFILTTVDCGAAPAISNGFYEYSGATTYTNFATLVCNDGYQLFGTARRDCQITGAWTSSDAFCQFVASSTASRSGTPKPSQSRSRSRTSSPTPKPSQSSSRTTSPSYTSTASRSWSPSRTASRTSIPTRTRTRTPSPTPKPSMSRTRTRTPSRTASTTRSRTSSRTASTTRSMTRTATRTASPTAKPSPTSTRSRTRTRTPSRSATRTASPTPKPSSSPTNTPSRTRSRTSTMTRTPSRTRSMTSTNTRTASSTRSMTKTASTTMTRTASTTRTRTPSTTRTRTPSPSMTATPSISVSPSASEVEECGCNCCEDDCGCCGCESAPLTEINLNFERMFCGISF